MLRLLPLMVLAAGCTAGEFSSWPANCQCRLSRTQAWVSVRCPDAKGEGRGVKTGISAMAHTQLFAHGSLIIHRTGKDDAFVDGALALVEYGAKTDHQGVPMYPVDFHKLHFPATEGYDVLGALAEKTELAESRIDEATFWCEDADAN